MESFLGMATLERHKASSMLLKNEYRQFIIEYVVQCSIAVEILRCMFMRC